jgi:hypothetical protein
MLRSLLLSLCVHVRDREGVFSFELFNKMGRWSPFSLALTVPVALVACAQMSKNCEEDRIIHASNTLN